MFEETPAGTCHSSMPFGAHVLPCFCIQNGSDTNTVESNFGNSSSSTSAQAAASGYSNKNFLFKNFARRFEMKKMKIKSSWNTNTWSWLK